MTDITIIAPFVGNVLETIVKRIVKSVTIITILLGAYVSVLVKKMQR